MTECIHEKVYSDNLLLSDPPQQEWICKKCGKCGHEVTGKRAPYTEYENIKQLFADKKNLKTFADLNFESADCSSCFYESQAKLDFENGYGVSVITGPKAYTSFLKPYEVGLIKCDHLWYESTLGEYIFGWCEEIEVTAIMIMLQRLEKEKE